MIRYPNVYGIDMPSKKELVAYGRTHAEVAEYIGADLLIYQDLDDLIGACLKLNPNISSFDVSVFNGEYVTGDIDVEYMNRLELTRGKALGPSFSEPIIPESSTITSTSYGPDTTTIGLFNSYYRR
jgi:hypothetical protein